MSLISNPILYWASVLLALSRQNGQFYVSLISRGSGPGFSRAYISLYYVRAHSPCATGAHYACPRHYYARPKCILPPAGGGRVGIDIETIRGSTRLGWLLLQRYGGPVQDSPGRPESQYRRPESQYRIHASQYRIHASQYRIHVTHY